MQQRLLHSLMHICVEKSRLRKAGDRGDEASGADGMSKEAEARVRDELLQKLYSGVLRCTLAMAAAGVRGAEYAAGAAGIAANLQPADMLLLPARGAAGFRVMRGLAPGAKPDQPVRERAAGVIALPNDEPQAVAMALGAAAMAAHAGQGALVCAVLPAAAVLDNLQPKPKASGLPVTWNGAGVYAAQAGLPLLVVTNRMAPKQRNAHRLPAPLFPAIVVDREDALAIYRVGYECASRARIGLGPSLIRCVPFAEPGTEAGRPDGEQESALARLESMLRKRGAFQKAWHRQLERQLLREMTG
jgi:hypothetical protein